MSNDCKHERFHADVNVNRLLDTGKFMAEIHIRCVECGEPFRFIGLPAGVHFEWPTVSIDETTLHAPIEPEGAKRIRSDASYHMPAIPRRH